MDVVEGVSVDQGRGRAMTHFWSCLATSSSYFLQSTRATGCTPGFRCEWKTVCVSCVGGGFV